MDWNELDYTMRLIIIRGCIKYKDSNNKEISKTQLAKALNCNKESLCKWWRNHENDVIDMNYFNNYKMIEDLAKENGDLK